MNYTPVRGLWLRLSAVLLVGFLAYSASAQDTPPADPPPATATEEPKAETPAETPPAAETPAEAPKTENPAEPAAEGTTVAAPEFDVPDLEILNYSVDNLMLFICAVLVIFMQAGFALVEAGLNSAKNCVNILFKNTADFLLGVIAFYVIGYALMYPGGAFAGKYFGYAQPDFTAEVKAEDIHAGFSTAPGTLRKLNPYADFLFQAAFCATAATIVSGSVAGRLKFHSYLFYTVVITAFVYPVSGFWKWGGGWLATMGFHDFAGSIVVHAVGGIAGLMGAIALGPRIGKYTSDGKPMAIPGHNLSMVCLGVFVLMIGWYGFNPGSQLAFSGMGNTAAVCKVAVNTTLAGCAGGIVGMFLSWILFKKPDLTFCLNGILAGLVGITANCDCVTQPESILIGAIAGVLVIIAAIVLDKVGVDDPVGAFPVHGVCGMWGGIATGLFGDGKDIAVQCIGTFACVAWSAVIMAIVFFGLKAIGQLRVSKEEEIEGLDLSEHGMMAYAPDPK